MQKPGAPVKVIYKATISQETGEVSSFLPSIRSRAQTPAGLGKCSNHIGNRDANFRSSSSYSSSLEIKSCSSTGRGRYRTWARGSDEAFEEFR